VESHSEEIVVCADGCREIYRSTVGWKGQLLIVAMVFFWVGLGVATGLEWLTLIGFATFFLIVVRIMVKAHKFVVSLSCPQCGMPAGKYETRKTRIHLCCQHCGHVAPTDCRIYYNGGIPEKG
jgi:predicted RNA-binding Zn-ribbon protein involved in translation (DUF1610 family)